MLLRKGSSDSKLHRLLCCLSYLQSYCGSFFGDGDVREGDVDFLSSDSIETMQL